MTKEQLLLLFQLQFNNDNTITLKLINKDLNTNNNNTKDIKLTQKLLMSWKGIKECKDNNIQATPKNIMNYIDKNIIPLGKVKGHEYASLLSILSNYLLNNKNNHFHSYKSITETIDDNTIKTSAYDISESVNYILQQAKENNII